MMFKVDVEMRHPAESHDDRNDGGLYVWGKKSRESTALPLRPQSAGDLLVQTGSKGGARDNTQSRRDEGRSTINDHYNYGNAR